MIPGDEGARLFDFDSYLTLILFYLILFTDNRRQFVIQRPSFNPFHHGKESRGCLIPPMVNPSRRTFSKGCWRGVRHRIRRACRLGVDMSALAAKAGDVPISEGRRCQHLPVLRRRVRTDRHGRHEHGKILDIQGNPDSPISRHLCPKGAATYQLG